MFLDKELAIILNEFANSLLAPLGTSINDVPGNEDINSRAVIEIERLYAPKLAHQYAVGWGDGDNQPIKRLFPETSSTGLGERFAEVETELEDALQSLRSTTNTLKGVIDSMDT